VITVQVLEKDDIIQSGDWCRPLYITSMSGGMSDDYSFESYGRPINNAKWCTVDVSYPFWIGKCVNEMPERIRDYEFVRGNVPAEHIHADGRI